MNILFKITNLPSWQVSLFRSIDNPQRSYTATPPTLRCDDTGPSQTGLLSFQVRAQLSEYRRINGPQWTPKSHDRSKSFLIMLIINRLINLELRLVHYNNQTNEPFCRIRKSHCADAKFRLRVIVSLYLSCFTASGHCPKRVCIWLEPHAGSCMSSNWRLRCEPG
jgi:hypothetical protein